FAAAEFIGGAFMIVLLVVLGRVVFGPRQVAEARGRLAEAGAGGVEDGDAVALERAPWREKLTSRAAWADAAGYTMADITMLRKELAIGYGVAGFLAVMVPMRAWNDLFLTGHGFWTSVENVLVGP